MQLPEPLASLEPYSVKEALYVVPPLLGAAAAVDVAALVATEVFAGEAAAVVFADEAAEDAETGQFTDSQSVLG